MFRVGFLEVLYSTYSFLSFISDYELSPVYKLSSILYLYTRTESRF